MQADFFIRFEINLHFLHNPKMGYSENLQRRLFQKLQHAAQKFSQNAKPRNDIVVRAEDDRLLDEFNRQAIEEFQHIPF